MKKALKIILIIILIPIVAFGAFLLYATLADYKPSEKILLYESEKFETISDTLEFNLMIWNIGYCGLSKDMDFFYDGGKQVRTSKDNTEKNIEKITKILNYYSHEIDFFLLQEVDKNAKRSYHTNQYKLITESLPYYHADYAVNYKVFFVPMPLTNPLGKVDAGLATYSKYEPYMSARYSFPGNYSWPTGIFMLDRCFMESRFSLENGKDLIIINTHNSAYDDGSLKAQQLEYLKKYLIEEYEKGNYIVVGGDWNQCPSDFKPNFDGYLMDNISLSYIPNDYLSDWTWAYQDSIPTNRRLTGIYNKKETLTTVIDYFLLSPNIEKISVTGLELNFQNSDHQPVVCKIKLKN